MQINIATPEHVFRPVPGIIPVVPVSVRAFPALRARFPAIAGVALIAGAGARYWRFAIGKGGRK